MIPSTQAPPVDSSMPQDGSTSSTSIVRTPWEPFTGIDVPFVGPAGPTSIAVLVADTEAKRSLGLMNRTDLGGYDGMVFAFENDTTTSFFMKNTKIPLTIFFFTAGGKYVSQTDMTPCTSDPCPIYGADAPYRYALEVMTGTATELGLVAGVNIDWAAALR
jgi:uncharacterized membrane protein (UPF0127 family)